ncbi:MAG: DNA-directed RNA polymerase subunit K [Nanoarchaeota archaeon]|nr:DNA-directed RNA polymerase subunit K [Nanoarchaeota archaeon]
MNAAIKEIFTKYEVARILGARALQISMDAPLLIKIEKEELERIRYDPIRIAELELNGEVLPITVKRPLPKRVESKLRREIIPEKKEDAESIEKHGEKEIEGEGEIMELAKPEDEVDETEDAGEEVAGE